jgi:hypothetical protein
MEEERQQVNMEIVNLNLGWREEGWDPDRQMGIIGREKGSYSRARKKVYMFWH